MTSSPFDEAPDLSAHRKLVATLLSLHLELLSPQGDSLPDITRELWQRAESAQCRICGGWKADAEDAVDRMVQHILRLASRADWFASTSSVGSSP